MKLLLLLIAAVSLSASAQSIEPMIAECERQMNLGICTALIDKSDYPANATVLIAGVGRIPLDAYLKIRNADKQMCVLARAYCTIAPDGGECKTAKALWGR
jgi:hypothetical protein